MTALDEFHQDLRRGLDRLEEKGRLRSLRVAQKGLDFASNDYLSLNSSGRLLSLMQKAATDWDGVVGSTGSRLLRGHHESFEIAEEEFATFCGTESSLLFHSGYAANVGVIQQFISAEDTVFCDRLCHATILDGIRMSGARRFYFHHNDLDHLRDIMRKRERKGRSWIITESIFSMDGDGPDLHSLVDLAEQEDALLYLDEAHALGVVGSTGAGLAHSLGLSRRVAVLVFPCGKGPGLMGAFVCGSKMLRESMINSCRSFIFSTAQPPFLAHLLSLVFREISGMNVERKHLSFLSQQLREGLHSMNLDFGKSTSHIVPVILGSEVEAMRWMNSLGLRGIDARAIRPPSVPEGSSRIRVNLHAGHRVSDVECLLKELYSLLPVGVR